MSSDDDWRWQYFGGSPLARRLKKYGLIPAPKPAQMSNAMAELIEENKRAEEADEQWRQQQAASLHARREQERVDEQRKQQAAWQALVQEFGADTVVKIARRADPAFVLPEGLVKGRRPMKAQVREGLAIGALRPLAADLDAIHEAADVRRREIEDGGKFSAEWKAQEVDKDRRGDSRARREGEGGASQGVNAPPGYGRRSTAADGA